MDYKEIFFSVCEIAQRLPSKADWDANIDVKYGGTTYNTVVNKYIKEADIYIAERITLDLSKFNQLKLMVEAYDLISGDREMYMVKCFHSLFIKDLLTIYPEIENENLVLFYRLDENIYPLVVSKKEIIE